MGMPMRMKLSRAAKKHEHREDDDGHDARPEGRPEVLPDLPGGEGDGLGEEGRAQHGDDEPEEDEDELDDDDDGDEREREGALEEVAVPEEPVAELARLEIDRIAADRAAGLLLQRPAQGGQVLPDRRPWT